MPGTARLAFKIELVSEIDPNRTLVDNLGRAIVSKITIKLEGSEIMSFLNADVFLSYCDLWLTSLSRNTVG